MSEEKMNFKKLRSYAVIMVLAAVIVIIIAAMADDREAQYENQITEKEQLNVSIQNEIVRLKDEKYELTKENESLKAQAEEIQKKKAIDDAINQAWLCLQEGQAAEAAEKTAAIDQSAMTAEQAAAYQALSGHLATANQDGKTNEQE